MSFLDLEGKCFLVTGVANKKSVAYFVAKSLLQEGASIILTVQNEDNLAKARRLFREETQIYLLDVEQDDSFTDLKERLKQDEVTLDGMLHSIAFANFSLPPKPFHGTPVEDFLQATNISAFSLVRLADALKELWTKEASIVTISISNTKATSYGYLGPVKAMLDSVVCYLAKSFSSFSQVRFNAVCAGPLKTSASAGIPGYVNNYLFAEALTMHKRALTTQEVANTATFLLSSASSGINAANVVVDLGMSSNYFDQEVVERFSATND
ncbi:MAG: SDR family oxidoreductase [Bdellovibrionales bacterium]|jgi:enoyl-[acyl-carrier protein] reductase I|nr:SDR family oxidoreductase [Bdellovibrionales bacterium]MBT7669714.1 SDR family oxidoreductase [Bdellovibrionales bacterium]MBT7767384.1 SDR family oxidoreductase [Bdellovibrionales bacterium]